MRKFLSLKFLSSLLCGAVLAIAVVALTACAGAVPWNPQNNAGLTNVKLNWCPVVGGTAVEAEKAPTTDYKLCDVAWIDGKEKADVKLTADVAKGTVTYSATQVRAFSAFESRADVEKFVAEQFTKAAPEIRKALVEGLSRALGL